MTTDLALVEHAADPTARAANAPPRAEVLAIRTGHLWTAVLVDPERGHCRVAAMAGQGTYVCHRGLTRAAIRAAASDPAGRGYRSFGSLRIAYPDARRRRDLDC